MSGCGQRTRGCGRPGTSPAPPSSSTSPPTTARWRPPTPCSAKTARPIWPACPGSSSPPPAAGAGLTEAQAEAAGYQVTTSVLPASAVPRALVNHDTAGVTKLVADAATGVLLGASVGGDGAGDVIQSAVLAVRHHITAAELGATFHPYLTTAESLKLAAQAFTRDVARLSCCAA